MTRPLLGLIAAAALASGPAFAASEAAIEAKRQSAGRAWHSCLAQAAADLDDGVSDASTVATGVRGACKGHMRKMVALFSPGTSLSGIAELERMGQAAAVENATEAVLKQRAKRTR